jgi:hypothetical protein
MHNYKFPALETHHYNYNFPALETHHYYSPMSFVDLYVSDAPVIAVLKLWQLATGDRRSANLDGNIIKSH